MTRAAVVSPNTLIGRELRERLEGRTDLISEIRLLSADEDEVGQLAETAGAAAFVGSLDAEAFDGVELVFFCGTIQTDRPWIQRLPVGARAIVLSAGATSADATPAIAGAGGRTAADGALLALHPAGYGAALLLSRLAAHEVRGAQGIALLPVSTLGESAVDALFEQTRAILAFQKPKREPLQAQLAFNVAPSAADADDVARQVSQSLRLAYPFGLQLLDVGVFHGVGLSLRVELAAPLAARELRRALGNDPRVELARKPTSVSPVALAGSERLLLGEVRPAGAPATYWIWAAFDNLIRAGALAAVELAEEVLGGDRLAS